jgi:hypothetical protein
VHATLHVVAPEQLTVQPPAGQVTAHWLLPWHVTVVPEPTVSLQSLVPPHVTLLPVPASRVHVLPPAHVEVQLEPQLPPQLDCPAQLVVHPVPQLTLHSFFDSQLNVALLGGAWEPPSPPPPRVHAPPDVQVHVEPLQEHDPVHSRLPEDAPEQARTTPMHADATIHAILIVESPVFNRAGSVPTSRSCRRST